VRNVFLLGNTTPLKELKIYFNKKNNNLVVIEEHNPHIFNEFYLEYKCIHETTASYYPEMDGKVEKKN